MQVAGEQIDEGMDSDEANSSSVKEIETEMGRMSRGNIGIG